MSESPAPESVPKFKGYVLFTGPFAFRRLFLYVITPLLLLTMLVWVVQTVTPAPPREKLKARALSTVMARAMRHVRSAAISEGNMTLRVDRAGNYEKNVTNSHGTYSELVYGSSVFYRANADALAYWLTGGSAPLSETRADAYAALYANRWFTTGRAAVDIKNPPEPSSDVYLYLSVGSPSGAQLGSPVTADGRTTIPLAMKGATWFIPATGDASPLVASFTEDSTYGDLNYASEFTLAYGTGAVIAPHAVTAPRDMSAAWNATFGNPTITRLTFLGLLYLAGH